jgi:hypothetical protein
MTYPPRCKATKQTLLRTYFCDLSPKHEGEHIDLTHFHGWVGPKRTQLANFDLAIIASVCMSAAAVLVYLVVPYGTH